MKITKRGIPVKNRTWIGKCRSCESEATAEQHELTHISLLIPGLSLLSPTDEAEMEGMLEFSWEKCPVCEIGNDDGYGGMLFYPAVDK